MNIFFCIKLLNFCSCFLFKIYKSEDVFFFLCLKFFRKWEYIVWIINKIEKIMVYNCEIVGMGNC